MTWNSSKWPWSGIWPPELATLFRIKNVTDAAFSDLGLHTSTAAISAAALADIAHIINEASWEVTQKLPSWLSLMTESYGEWEYIIPESLKEFHESFVTHIASGKSFHEFWNSGLALYWAPWNGKSEYPAYLKSLLSEKTDCYKVSIGTIRHSENPVEALNEVYSFLRDKYSSSDRYAIVLMDEWDEAFGAKKWETVSSKSTDSSWPERSVKSNEERSSYEVDPIGVSLSSSLKTILATSEESKRVFTVTTTNKDATEVPAALLRDGRLSKLELPNPFTKTPRYKTKLRMKNGGTNLHSTGVPNYAYFYKYIIEMIDIFITTENRADDTKEARITLLEEYKSEIQCSEIKIEPLILLDEPLFNKDWEEEKNIKTVVDSQQARIRELLKLLWHKTNKEVLDEFPVFWWIPSFSQEEYPELEWLAWISRSHIAKMYKVLRQSWEKINKKKIQELLAWVIFPQLK